MTSGTLYPLADLTVTQFSACLLARRRPYNESRQSRAGSDFIRRNPDCLAVASALFGFGALAAILAINNIHKQGLGP